MNNIPIPDSVIILKHKDLAHRIRFFNRAPIYYKLLKNPLNLDKNGLMIDYMRAFNDISDVVEYERPNKYNFKLVSR